MATSDPTANRTNTEDGAGAGGTDRWARTVELRSTRAHGRRTLVKLLDAAVAEFAAYGYHGARMARIAKRAGTAHGTIYVYFEDKDDLLSALYDDVKMELEPKLGSMPALEPGPEGFKAVHDWTSQVCASLQRHGAVLQAITEALSDEQETKAGRVAMRTLAQVVAHSADRIRATGTTGVDPAIAALCIHALIEGANRSVMRGELLISMDELVTGLSEFIHHSVFAAPRSKAASP
jgi:AcrR family transcriptional regulator